MTTTPPLDGTKLHDTLAQQQTMPFPALAIPGTPLPDAVDDIETPPAKRTFTRMLPLILLLALIVAVYFVWNPPVSTSSSPGSNVTQQNFGAPATTNSKNSQANTNNTTGSGNIQDYIVGAVKNPGVYTLPTGSRGLSIVTGRRWTVAQSQSCCFKPGSTTDRWRRNLCHAHWRSTAYVPWRRTWPCQRFQCYSWFRSTCQYQHC